jgi:hypothetical protein
MRATALSPCCWALTTPQPRLARRREMSEGFPSLQRHVPNPLRRPSHSQARLQWPRCCDCD